MYPTIPLGNFGGAENNKKPGERSISRERSLESVSPSAPGFGSCESSYSCAPRVQTAEFSDFRNLSTDTSGIDLARESIHSTRIELENVVSPKFKDFSPQTVCAEIRIVLSDTQESPTDLINIVMISIRNRRIDTVTNNEVRRAPRSSIHV